MYHSHPQYQHFPTIAQPQHFMPYQFSQKRTDVSKDDPHMPTIQSVLQQITQELKQILKRDFNKKMVENTAFKRFETWWEEESCKENKNVQNEDIDVTKGIVTKDNINVLLEANREHLYNNSKLDSLELGLGLRASLPKMPSFRRKKIPSPVPEDEDSRKLSDNEEIIHDSDAETRNKPLNRVRKPSTSSSSSDSSIFSSSSDASSSDESSSDTEQETERTRKTSWRSRTPEERTTPIPTNLDLSSPRNLSPISHDELSPIHVREKSDEKEEPMQVIENKSETVIPKEEFKYTTYSDSEMSEGEREYLEKRRRNTEYMEQIERERLEREKLIKPKSPSPIRTVIRKDSVVEVAKILEKKPAKSQDTAAEDIKAKESSAIDILTQMAQSKVLHVVEEEKKIETRLSESSDGSSPKSQVCLSFYCMCFI